MIDDFRGPYRWLSNFHLAPVLFEGHFYPSSEHAYQAAKSLDDREREPFRDAGMSCREAKRRGSALVLRPDWLKVRVPVMTVILIDKFTRHADLRQKLLDTDGQELVEGNTWHDRFWGVCKCQRCGDVGENNLGKVHMQIRSALKCDQ